MQDHYTSEYHMGNGSRYQVIVLFPIRRETGWKYWPVLDWGWNILVHDRFICNIIHIEKFCHQRWKIISVAQFICKSIHQGPGTGWLPNDIKTSLCWTFWEKLERIQAYTMLSEVTSEEWLIRESGYTQWCDEDATKFHHGRKCVYNCTYMMVNMGLDKILHNDREPQYARTFHAWTEDWESDILRIRDQENEQRLQQELRI